VEAYELTSHGGSTDFARLVGACESFGPYCLIGGLAVNCYVEPVFTLDAGLVMIAASLPELTAHLEAHGFKTDLHEHSLNALALELNCGFGSRPANGTGHSPRDRWRPLSWEFA